MCIEDVRIGRDTKPREVTKPVGTTQGEFIPHDPRRVALVISCPAANHLILHFGATGSDTQGMHIHGDTPPLQLDIKKHGSLVFGPFFAAVSAAGEDITYWETLLERQ